MKLAELKSDPPFVVPTYHDLSPSQFAFLNQLLNLRDLKQLLPSLESQLRDSQTSLSSLQNKLTKLVVSWISRSVSTQHSLLHLSRDLHNLSLLTSCYGNGLKMMHQDINMELPLLAKEVYRIKMLSSYAGIPVRPRLSEFMFLHVFQLPPIYSGSIGQQASFTFCPSYNISETTLQLEALVGDLEDTVFSILNQQTKSAFSASFSKSTDLDEVGAGHGKLLQTVAFMQSIEEVLTKVIKTQPQWHCLIKSVDSRVDKVLGVLRPKALADHRGLLASLGWPPHLLTSKLEDRKISELSNPFVLMAQDKRETYSQSFLGLCALQHIQMQREDRQLNCLGRQDHQGSLWAIDELVSPIASRIEHHFSKWATEQPELIFALDYRIAKDFVAGIDDVLQPLIDKARLLSFSAKEAWVFSMVQVVAGFLDKSIFPELADRYKIKELKSESIASWLHLVDLIISFDEQMLSLLCSEPGRLHGISRGISALSIFCLRPEWLKLWAKIELKDSWKKMKAEMKDEKSWLVNKAGGNQFNVDERVVQLLSDRVEYKAPLIAESAAKIAWDMIERCQTLPTQLLRAQFIRLTAGRFFWYFFNGLLHWCKRPEPLLDHRGQNDDLLRRTCVSTNAARYIESKLQEWNNDVNFLEMKMAEHNDSICFFDEEMKILAELETNWIMEIISDLLLQFENLSCGYFHKREPFEQEKEVVDHSKESSTMDISVSYTLIHGLDFIRDQLLSISTMLNAMDFQDLWRSVADGLDHYILSSLLKSGIQFSDEGLSQFEADMRAMFHIFRSFCERPEAFFPRIRDTLILLRPNDKEVMHFQANPSGRNSTKSCKLSSHLSSDLTERIMTLRKFRCELGKQ